MRSKLEQQHSKHTDMEAKTTASGSHRRPDEEGIKTGLHGLLCVHVWFTPQT